ncbi:hypothetical protein Trydic_g3009 [Trypoxylus dichotomus]
MNTCNQGYEVTYSSIKGTFSTTTQSESITVADLYICFEFDVTIRPVTASSSMSYGKATFYDPRALNVRFTIPKENPSQVIITWTHPNQEWCPSRYMVTYQTTSDNQVINVTIPELVFDFVYCTPVTLTIRGVNPNDDSPLSIQSATVVDATQYPEKLGYITHLNLTTRTDEMEISWNPTQPIGTCNISYRVVFTTDRGMFALATKEPTITFSRESFCFTVDVIIQAIAGIRAIDIGNTGGTYGIEAVDDVKLNVHHTNSTVTATWSPHPLQERCGVSYEVAFQRGNRIDIQTRSIPNITFDLIYCVNTTVNVRALRMDGGRSNPNNATNLEEFPTSLEPVQNVSFSKTEASVIVSWKVAASVINCENLYNVTARNGNTLVEDTCQGTIGCEISLPDFCPLTIFIIKPALSGEGEEVIETLEC